MFGGVGYLASPDHVLIERIGQFETFFFWGNFKLCLLPENDINPVLLTECFVGVHSVSMFLLTGLPRTEELLHLQFPNSYKTTVPKLLSALHITKNRTTLPGKDA